MGLDLPGGLSNTPQKSKGMQSNVASIFRKIEVWWRGSDYYPFCYPRKMSTPDHTNPKQTSSPRFSSPPPNSGSTGTADFMMSPIGHATAIGQSDFRNSATDPRLDFHWKRFFFPICWQHFSSSISLKLQINFLRKCRDACIYLLYT